MCTNKFILFCMGIVMSVSSLAWAGDAPPLSIKTEQLQ